MPRALPSHTAIPQPLTPDPSPRSGARGERVRFANRGEGRPAHGFNLKPNTLSLTAPQSAAWALAPVYAVRRERSISRKDAKTQREMEW